MSSRRRFWPAVFALVAAVALFLPNVAHAVEASNDELKTVRVGVLKFGTVNWELDTIKRFNLDQKNGIKLEVTGVVGKNASAIAIQGNAVDIIVTDYIWVSRQRAEGADYTFVPHSLTVGGLVVSPDSGINTLADLEGKRIGIAGGPVDKSWIILRAYGKQELGRDFADLVDTTFGAPPLINETLLKGDVDAVLNFWHFNARLKAKGMKQVIGVGEMLPALGVKTPSPLLGWVFHEGWASENSEAIDGFLKASLAAKEILRTDDAAWEALRKRMKAVDDDVVFVQLRDAYRSGIVTSYGPEQIAAAQKTFAILAELGGKRLVGDSTTLAGGTFWTGFSF